MSNTRIYYGKKADDELDSIVNNNHSIFVLCDSQTKKYCLPRFKDKWTMIPESHILCVPEGENSKDLAIALQLWENLLQENADNSSVLLNLGGGVVCDLGGFVASTFKRGIPFIHIPTSLTAQIDAAIGGKTAINIKGIKNQIGTFQLPRSILIFHELLQTLPEKECLSGFAEMLKHGLIADKKYWKQIKCLGEPEKIIGNPKFIQKSIRIKSKIVSKDFYDKKERRLLNFGHTVGHVLETLSIQRQEPVLHGEAVAWGMLAEAYISFQKGYLSKREWEEIHTVIKTIYKSFPIKIFSEKEWITLIPFDKKREGDILNVTLLKTIGHAMINGPCSYWELQKAFHYLNEQSSMPSN